MVLRSVAVESKSLILTGEGETEERRRGREGEGRETGRGERVREGKGRCEREGDVREGERRGRAALIAITPVVLIRVFDVPPSLSCHTHIHPCFFTPPPCALSLCSLPPYRCRVRHRPLQLVPSARARAFSGPLRGAPYLACLLVRSHLAEGVCGARAGGATQGGRAVSLSPRALPAERM